MRKQYALGGEITQFNEGGTHEQNPNGGIPMGEGASVEQGETAVSTPQGKFIFSDRIQITPQVANNLSLPKSWIGKTMADYSKKIDKQFQGREDSISTATKQRMLDRGANEQEQIKAEQEALAQAQTANSEQAPEDMMNGQVPEGSEEYAEPMQMEKGGIVPEDPMTGMEIASGVAGAAGTALQLGQTAFGKAQQDVTGAEASGRVSGVGMIGGSAIAGAAAGSKFGYLGAAIGGGLGLIGGIAGLGKERKAEALNTQRFAVNTNKSFSDNYAAEGGLLEQYKDTNNMAVDPVDPKKGKIKNADGSYSMRTTTTTSTPGIKGYTIKGNEGSPAVLGTKGINSIDVDRNKAFASARKSGESTFMYKGKSYTTEMSGTKPIPAVNPTPDIVVPGLPPRSNTIVEDTPLQADVYKVNATRGTIGGARRDGIGGSVTTGQQFTSNPNMASKLVEANNRYNAKIEEMYAPDTENLRGLNPAQLELKNAKAAQRLIDLRGRTTVDTKEVPMGLERPNVNELRSGVQQFAEGGYVKKFNKGVDFARIDPLKSKTDVNFGKISTGAVLPETAKPAYDVANAYTDKLKLVGRDALAGGKNFVKNDLGSALRYAAPLTDAYQLSQLKKPQGERLDRLDNTYVPRYADESRQQNIADQELSNTVNSIQQSGASQGQARASILGAQLNKTKALSSAYAQTESTNAQQDAMKQQFKLGVDQTNLSQSNAEKENIARDKGAYDTEKSKLISSLGESTGDIGKEERFKKMTKGMFGYDTNGKYVIGEDGGKLYIDGGTKKTAALGGLINRKYK